MSQSTTFAGTPVKSAIENFTIRAISWRLIPFLVLAYFFSYLDRVNLGFAALTMNAELKFTPLIFAWGAGIFFIGYFIFEVPSNLALEKFGASRWIARIMVTWGIISALMATVSGETSFYVLRCLLGVAEAGFFPGIILYLTYWYPAEYRARFLAAFAIAVPVSTVIGAPISGLLLGLDGAMGLKGWQGCSSSRASLRYCSALSPGSISPTGLKRPAGSPPSNAAGCRRGSSARLPRSRPPTICRWARRWLRQKC